MSRLMSFDRYLSERGKRAEDALITDPQSSAAYISFIYGFPDAASLPAETVAEVTRQVLETDGEWALQYGKVTGASVILDTIREKLARDQGLRIGPDEVMMTAGSSQAIQLLVQLLVNPGDVVVAEAPSFLGFYDDIHNAGAEIAGVPVDEDGIDVLALERVLTELRDAGRDARFIYTLPNFHNPTGVTATRERRQRVIELARAFDTLIVEDDAYYDLRYDGEDLPTIASLDPDGRTFYLGTLSKTLAAGFRLGWLTGPAPLLRRVSSLKTDGGTNIFGSYVAAAWMEKQFTGHVDQLREIYRRRRDLMLEALDRFMPEDVTWSRPDGGFFIWLTLPEGCDTGPMLDGARERGIEFLPGRVCFANGSGSNHIRLSFSFPEDDQIARGIEILGELVRAEIAESAAVA